MKKRFLSVSIAILLTCGLFDGLAHMNQMAYAQTRTAQTATANVADKIISTGMRFKGTPYIFGARSGQTRSFDCSTFTQYIYGLYGIDLPRTSREQATVGTTISKSNLRKGDLLFFKTGNRSDGKIDHVAVYLGNGQLLHTIPNGGVQVSSFTDFWESTYVGAKRVI